MHLNYIHIVHLPSFLAQKAGFYSISLEESFSSFADHFNQTWYCIFCKKDRAGRALRANILPFICKSNFKKKSHYEQTKTTLQRALGYCKHTYRYHPTTKKITLSSNEILNVESQSKSFLGKENFISLSIKYTQPITKRLSNLLKGRGHLLLIPCTMSKTTLFFLLAV